MENYNNILIKNIYYMLSYAFSSLRTVCNESVETEEFENIHDLLSVILYKGISNQIKRGLNKEYLRHVEPLSLLRGKINIADSIKQNTIIKSSLVCEFDEFSENSLLNQVLKSVCILLIKKGNIEKDNKKRLKKILLYFSNVDEIEIDNINWKAISYHRNNATYKMLIHICYLIVKGLLIKTNSGDLVLSKWFDEQKMYSLYEKFVLEYYKKHYPELSASAPYIDWDLDDECDKTFLPVMQTDITLKYNNKYLIIDTKFYSSILNENYGKLSISSGNLYQIYAYVKNKDKDNTGNVSGMLLYAKTTEDLTPDQDYKIGGSIISVKTLDLNQDWHKITLQLNVIAENFKNNI